jgi:hypothetical protein
LKRSFRSHETLIVVQSFKHPSVLGCFEGARTAFSPRRRTYFQTWRSRLPDMLILNLNSTILQRRRSRLDSVHILHVLNIPGHNGAYWTLVGPPGASWRFLRPLGSCLGSAVWSRAKVNSHDCKGSACHFLLRVLRGVVALHMLRVGGWKCIFHSKVFVNLSRSIILIFHPDPPPECGPQDFKCAVSAVVVRSWVVHRWCAGHVVVVRRWEPVMRW